MTLGFRCDLNGNLLSDGLKGYEYYDANQLVRVTVTNHWKAEFSCDGLGRRRIVKDYSWSDASWTLTHEVRYVRDGMVVLQERDGANAVKVTYTRGLDLSGTRQGAGGIGGLLARTDANGTTFYHSDAGGNITAMTDGNGNVVARYLYDPFGNLLAKSGAMADVNRYRFSSKEVHPTSGLYYYGYRFYEPNLQRWLNEDPIGEAGGINLYGFVGNTPINLVDVFGFAPYKYDPYDPSTWIFPKDGRWSGRPGSSLWTPPAGSDIAQATKGQPIQWNRGTPNLRDFSAGASYNGKAIPKCVKGIPFTGDSSADRNLAIKKLAEQSGLKQYQVEAALSRANMRLHHYFNGEMHSSPTGLRVEG